MDFGAVTPSRSRADVHWAMSPAARKRPGLGLPEYWSARSEAVGLTAAAARRRVRTAYTVSAPYACGRGMLPAVVSWCARLGRGLDRLFGSRSTPRIASRYGVPTADGVRPDALPGKPGAVHSA